jgi:hypothetical protein
VVADFTHVPLDGGGFGFCIDPYAGLIAGLGVLAVEGKAVRGMGDPAG